MRSPLHFNVIVVGGGIVGATLALALARKGIHCALVEPSGYAAKSISADYSLRVSALSLSSRNILYNLGVWDTINPQRIQCYSDMLVCDQASGSHIEFNSAELHQPCLGYIVENDLIQAQLFKQIEKHEHIKLFNTTLKNIELSAKTVVAELNDTDILSAQLIVGADGAASMVRDLSGLPFSSRSYNQQALVAHITPGYTKAPVAWQRFLSGGPLAFLPLADGRFSIVWSLPEEQIQEVLHSSDTNFCKSLSEASEYVFGEISNVSARAAFPLQYLQASDYVTNRVALVGDAAHVVHPLAGQGVNLGLLDAAQLAEELVAIHQMDKDLGHIRHLRRYARCRKAENTLMGWSLDALKKLFDSELASVAHIRGLGLRYTNRSKTLKHFFMREAMGVNRQAPALAKYS